MQQKMKLMMVLLPMVQDMVKVPMEKYGFDGSNLMMGMMQIQMHSMSDPAMQPKVERIMKALQGDISK